jgi:hypothetical protein
MSSEWVISRAAPEIDMLLIRQPMVLSAKSIAPDIKTTLRAAERLSMKHYYAGNP